MSNDTITYYEMDMFISSYPKNIFLKYCDIVAITTNRPYVVFYTKDDMKGVFVNSTLHEIIERLPYVFFLINQSTIINLFNLTAFTRSGSVYLFHLDSKQEYKVARRKRKEFWIRLSYLKQKCSLDCEHRMACNRICMKQNWCEYFNASQPNSI